MKASEQLKQQVLDAQQGACLECGLKEWNGKPLTLELDHIDGNRTHNVFENLRYLCPNCHSQTITWRGRNKKRVVFDEDAFVAALKEHRTVYAALTSLGLAAKGGNYGTAYKLIYKHGLHDIIDIKHKNKIIRITAEKEAQAKHVADNRRIIASRNNEKLERLQSAAIDFSVFGWVEQAARVLEITPQKVGKWMAKNAAELYSTCYKRKSKAS